VEPVLAEKEDVTFIFDIHRDSLPRERTTAEINGQDYARTYFIIGGQNEQHERNLAFAERFHNALEAAYPGLSRGVYLKHEGDGEYNQSLSENNLLIEIGGVENTLEESYRTVEVLADVIADLYWDAEKVDAPQ
jgi:stage II sporulation protein P